MLSSKLCNLCIDSFIEHNIGHFHPAGKCSYDLPNQPDEAVTTEESPCGCVAMKELFKKFK